jgi:AcrR family transcriptional regulator
MNHKPTPSRPLPPSDARATRTRAALTRAILRLLRQKPFDRITIRDIATEAGIGYATFFRHYDSKEMLLHDVAADEIGMLLSLARPAFEAADMRASAEALCAHVSRHRALWSALMTGGAAGIVREEFIRQAKKIPHAPARRARWLPPDLGVIHGVSATVEILTWWLRQRQRLPVKRIAEILYRLVLAPTMSAR